MNLVIDIRKMGLQRIRFLLGTEGLRRFRDRVRMSFEVVNSGVVTEFPSQNPHLEMLARLLFGDMVWVYMQRGLRTQCLLSCG